MNNYNCFLDVYSSSYKYLLGIINYEIDDKDSLSNILKQYKNMNIDYLALCTFNYQLEAKKSKESSSKNLKAPETSIISINNYLYKMRKRYDFTVLFSYEVSCNPLGYFNFWNADDIFHNSVTSFKQLSDFLKKNKSCFLSLKKPTIGIYNLPQYSLFKDRFRLIEIKSTDKTNNISVYENIYYSLLDKGWQIGAISELSLSSNNDINSFTGICSNNHHVSSIIEALYKRNTYYSLNKYIKLYFSCLSNIMGSIIHLDKTQKYIYFYVYIKSKYYSINKIQIITNEKSIFKEMKIIPLHDVKYCFKVKAPTRSSWYVAKIYSDDKVLAISSPIFLI